ncbi:MAG: TonB-dependent receptor [Woeseiaceae bacterium]|jgi:iron complex outermembrane receptor protein|nr:TonB-dependent receptor [Woeseiaceae bacterium]
MSNKRILAAGVVASTLALTALPVSAWAQALEEITVTAQKREQSIDDVGISITAFSGEAINALGFTNTQQITQQVPNLQLQTFTPAFTVFNIRGVSQNNFQDNLEAPVAVYVDDVYIASMNAIGQQMFDMERIEVLRGPQGTLFGRNATGGLIHYVTRRASDEELNGYARTDIADFGSLAFEGAIGGAFGERARGRLAARWEQSDGYVEPGISPFTGERVAGRDSHGADGYSIRGSLQFDIGASSLLDLVGYYSEDKDVPSGQYVVKFADADPDTGLGVPLPGNDPLDGGFLAGSPWKHASDEDAFFDRDTQSLTARFTSNLANGMEFMSITNFTSMDKYYQEDAGGGLVFFPYTTIADHEQWSQEFRLSGETERTRWQLGAYYLDMDMATTSIVEGPAITGSPEGIIPQNFEMSSRNWSLFAQGEYDFGSAFTVIAGLRWSQDDKSAAFQTLSFNMEDQGIPSGTVLFDLADEAVGEFAGVPEIDYGDFAARLQLNYVASDNTLWFLSWNRGIKGGNWSPNSAVSIEDFQHKEEVLNAYELGVKTAFADGALRLHATAFAYDYQDYQAFSLTGLTPQVTNSDATAAGGEVELYWTANANWDVVMGAAFLDSKVDFVPAVVPGTGTTDAEFPNAPATSFNGLVRYHWPVASGEVSLQLDGRWNDDQFLEGTNSLVSKQDAYFVGNARVAYTTERYEIAAWLKNFTDEVYLLYNLDLGAAGFVEQVYAPPQQWGLTLRVNW